MDGPAPGAHPAVVAVHDPASVAGFGSLSPFRDRAAYATTVEDSVYVAAEPGAARAWAGCCSTSSWRSPAATGFHSVIARISGDNGPRSRCTGPAASSSSAWNGGGPQVRALDRRRRPAADALTVDAGTEALGPEVPGVR